MGFSQLGQERFEEESEVTWFDARPFIFGSIRVQGEVLSLQQIWFRPLLFA